MHLLRQVWQAWRAFGRFMGDMVGRVVMTLFYFTIALPFGLAVRFLSDPLQLKAVPPRWSERERPDQARAQGHARAQVQALDDARRLY